MINEPYQKLDGRMLAATKKDPSVRCDWINEKQHRHVASNGDLGREKEVSMKA
jgi:hypothetical protein